LTVLIAAAALYLWDLGASGWANSFYAAAVQAGTRSWKAFFFGSFDSSNFITVDKPPASLWVMELSARVFGLSSWSILVPQALEGVAAVALVYATVRRWSSAGAGLLAASVMALTPVATLMFRYDNPDALLVLLLCAAAYATTVATDRSSTVWLMLAFALVGVGFMTKMLQADLVVPAMALTFFIAAPGGFWRRTRQLAAGGGALVVASLWWVAVVMVVPAADRPYIGGSQDNSLWNLIFGYNGFGRLTGNEAGSVAGGAVGTSGRWGITGLTRLFGSEMGTQISWLLPAALVLMVGVLVVTMRQRRTDRSRAAMVLWGGWLLVTGLVFSFGQGIIHPYYNVALAPAIGAVVGIGASTLWARRSSPWARMAISAVVLLSAMWSYVLLGRDPSWYPALRTTVLATGIAAAVLLAIWPLSIWPLSIWPLSIWRLRGTTLTRRALKLVVGGLTATAVLAGPAAYSLATAATPHSGAIPTAGPSVAATGAFPSGRSFRAAGFGGRSARAFAPGTGGVGPATRGFAPGGPRGSAALPSGAGSQAPAAVPKAPADLGALAVSRVRAASRVRVASHVPAALGVPVASRAEVPVAAAGQAGACSTPAPQVWQLPTL
jgi:4-amino-4-deoxy-L-arabinose transferase-like glycosyltransferase